MLQSSWEPSQSDLRAKVGSDVYYQLIGSKTLVATIGLHQLVWVRRVLATACLIFKKTLFSWLIRPFWEKPSNLSWYLPRVGPGSAVKWSSCALGTSLDDWREGKRCSFKPLSYQRSVATIQGAWCSEDDFSSPPLCTMATDIPFERCLILINKTHYE